MDYRALAFAALATCCALGPPVAQAAPAPDLVPPTAAGELAPRTAISVRSLTGLSWGTADEHQVRSALSLAKLYLTDYALRHGDGSAGDLAHGERMIRYSDDAAADAVAAKYPGAIASVAAEYGLAETRPGANWGSSTTSTADVADFLDAKLRTDPASPILSWMATAAPRAADGTEQNWGTAALPGVQGTKWGWADAPPQEVASASFGPGFTVAAHTRGGPADQTADVLGALSSVLPGRGGPTVPSVPAHTSGPVPVPEGSWSG
ncbi:hypothetical protein [Nocardia rhamnosiphila]|uniref:Serine hydrolase n=1 Tax=Nocardia rhamnosiphila TaxID=426716 RepID=A0ABV2WI94_9NOCA